MTTKIKQNRMLLITAILISLALLLLPVSAAAEGADSGDSETTSDSDNTDSTSGENDSGSESSSSGESSESTTTTDSGDNSTDTGNDDTADTSESDGDSGTTKTTETTGSESSETESDSDASGEPGESDTSQEAETAESEEQPEAGADEPTEDQTEPDSTADDEDTSDGETGSDEEGEPGLTDSSSETGNSYIATVTPEDGKKVEAESETGFTVTFTELGETDKLGSAQLTIPESLKDLSFNAESIVVLDQDGNRDDAKTEKWSGSLLDRVLSLWADNSHEDNYLTQNWSVSAKFSATANDEQTHHFSTEAWTNASEAPNEGEPYDTSSLYTNNRHADYGDPKINVWVDGESGYAEGNSSNGELTRGDTLDDVTAARNHDGDLFTGLEDVHENLNWHYVQTEEDIDLSGDWDPIGDYSNPFTGSFDGNGNIIANLTINDATGFDLGLFGFTAESAVITNVNLRDVDITAGSSVGALVGTNKGKIIDSHAAGRISVTENGTWGVGGLVGENDGGSIVNSSADVDITVNSSGTHDTSAIGGLIGASGYTSSGGNVSKSHATGKIDINATDNVEYVGGLIGFNREADITESYATGNITIVSTGGTVEYVGGLVGGNGNFSVVSVDGDFGGNISDSYYETGTISVTADDHVFYVAGLAGYSKNGDITGSHVGIAGDPVEITVESAGGVWGVGGLVGDFYNGSITDSHAYAEITVGSESTKDYDGIGGLIGYGENTSITDSSAQGSITVGTDVSRVGSASFIGGLAGYTDAASITNSEADVDITIYATGLVELIGGLVGVNIECNITGSNALGYIKIDSSNGVVKYVGGLIGANGYTDSSYTYEGGNVFNSHATGSITITATNKVEYVGGLVGVNGDYNSKLGGNITNSSYKTGTLNITASDNEVWNVGGLTGYSSGGDVKNSSVGDATKPVTINVSAAGGVWGVGGLVGDFDNGSITDSHAYAEITVGSESTKAYDGIGGLIGYGENTSITDSSAQGSITVGPEDNRVRSASFIGGLIGGTDVASITNSEANVTIDIYAENNVQWIGGLVGDNDECDITGSSALGDITIDANGAVKQIGGFAGEISGSSVSESSSAGNITITGNDLATDKWVDQIGGFAGYADGSTTIQYSKAAGSITVTVTGAVDSAGYVGDIGGFIGTNDATISNSYTRGDLSVTTTDVAYTQLIGFFVGDNDNDNGSIDRAYSTGTLTVDTNGGASGFIGGFAGDEGVITNSFYLDSNSGNEAEMKTLALYEDEDWSILPYADFDPADPQAATWYIKEGLDYPILWWEHSRYGEVIGPDYSLSVFGFDAKLSLFERIMALLEPIATADFVSNGGFAELENARSAYSFALHLYEENSELLTGEEQRIVQTYFALAEMAMLALEVKLLNAAGESYNLALLEQSFLKAQELFAQNMHLLSTEQIATVEALFAAVSTLVTSLSSI